MAKVIVGIHGLANKPPRRVLQQWWKAAIVEGLRKNLRIRRPRPHFHLVYWADLLHKRAQHQDTDFAYDELFNTQPYRPAARGALRRYDDSWYDRPIADAREALHSGLELLKTELGLDRAVDELLAKKLRDLAYYWDPKQKLRDRRGRQGTARDVLDAECRSALLAHADDEILLIAHSMGSIISYNVLRDMGHPARGGKPPLTVSHFVTIGSPLGLQMVRDSTRRSRWDKKVRTPTIVAERWVNFADRKDPVAFDTHLRDDYGQNDVGVQVVDDLVLNDYVSPTSVPNPHKSYGYLRTPEMSDLIASFLSQ